MTRKVLSARLFISDSKTYRLLQKLKKEGRIERIGPAKGGHWLVK